MPWLSKAESEWGKQPTVDTQFRFVQHMQMYVSFWDEIGELQVRPGFGGQLIFDRPFFRL